MAATPPTILLEQIRKPVWALLCVVGLLTAGAVLAAYRAETGAPPANPKTPPLAKIQRTDLYGDPLPADAVTRLGTLRFRHGWMSLGVAFSPDGKLLATKGAFGKGICLWDPATGRELRRFETPDRRQDNRSFSLVFSPDGKTLATAKGGSARLYDVASGKEVMQLQANQERISCVAFSPDGKLLASGSEQGTISLWDSLNGREVRRPQENGEWVGRVVFAPDGKMLAANGEGKTVYLWDVETGKLRRRLPLQGVADVFAFTPDGKLLAVAGKDTKVDFWDPVTGKLARALESHLDARPWAPDYWLAALAFAPGGKILAASGYGGIICLLDVETGTVLHRLTGNGMSVTSLAFSPDGKTLAAAATIDSAPHLWDVATGKEIHSQTAHFGAVSSMAFAGDGRSLVSYGLDNRALVWDLSTGKARQMFRIPQALRSIGFFAPGGRSLAYRDSKKTVTLWDMDKGKNICQLAVPEGLSLAFSPDGRLVACECNDKTIRLWNVAAKKEIRCLKGKPGEVSGALVFAPDGKRLASWATSDGMLRIWDVGTGQVLRQWHTGVRYPNGLAFSPDGTALATASSLDRVAPRIWEAATGREVRRLSGQEDCDLIAFSPDGRLVVTGVWQVDSAPVRLCETLTGQEARRFQGHFGGVGCVAFSPDGRSVVSGGNDSTILVWDVTGRRATGRALPLRLEAADLERLWSDLGGDAAKAHEAIWQLVAAREQAVALLARRLRPVAAPDHERIVRLVAELASERFLVRDKATKALESLGELAEPELRQALDQSPLEFRRRIERLLERCSPRAVPTRERLQQLRAVAALEYLGTPPARQVLDELAKGVQPARLTREACMALERLAKHTQRPD